MTVRTGRLVPLLAIKFGEGSSLFFPHFFCFFGFFHFHSNSRMFLEFLFRLTYFVLHHLSDCSPVIVLMPTPLPPILLLLLLLALPSASPLLFPPPPLPSSPLTSRLSSRTGRASSIPLSLKRGGVGRATVPRGTRGRRGGAMNAIGTGEEEGGTKEAGGGGEVVGGGEEE